MWCQRHLPLAESEHLCFVLLLAEPGRFGDYQVRVHAVHAAAQGGANRLHQNYLITNV